MSILAWLAIVSPEHTKNKYTFVNIYILSSCFPKKDKLGIGRNSSRLTVDTGSKVLAFSPEEQELILSLPREKVIVPPASLGYVHFGLADILCCHCYSLPVLSPNCGQDLGLSVLSGSPEVLVSSMRRALCYPLYRHYDHAKRW